jgi:hypothetical protein
MLTSTWTTWLKRLTPRGTPGPARLRVEGLEDRFCPAAFDPQNLLVVTGSTLREYTPAAALVQSFDIPYPGTGDTETPRDVVVGPDAQAHVYNGSLNPYLSSLDPVAGTWTHLTLPGWSTLNVVGYGGVGSYNQYVFASDMSTFDGPENGLIRFDTSTGTSVRFADGVDFTTVTVGLDGQVYALGGTFSDTIRVYDPNTLALLRTVPQPDPDPRGLAVDAAGDLFTSDWNGHVYHSDPNGNVLADLDANPLNLGMAGATNNLTDVAVSAAGELVVGTRYGDLIQTDEAFDNPTPYQLSPDPTYVSFASYQLPGSGATLHGTKFADLNGNGVRDPGEPGLAGVTIYLDLNHTGRLDPGDPVALTDANGNYAFTGVPPGNYVVREVIPAGYQQTLPGPQGDSSTYSGEYFGAAYAGTTGQTQLVDIDATGQVTRVGAPMADRMHGLVMADDGSLYGVNGFSNSFYSVNRATGQTTLIGPTGYTVVWGLTYDPGSDTIYGLARTDSLTNTYSLATIDRTTGAASVMGRGVGPLTGVSGLAFDAANNRVLVFDNNTERFYAYNATTGAATYLATASTDVHAWDMAFNGQYAVLQALGVNNDTVLEYFDPDTGAQAGSLTLSASARVESLTYVAAEPFTYHVTVVAGETFGGVDFGNFPLPGAAGGTGTRAFPAGGLPFRGGDDRFRADLTPPGAAAVSANPGSDVGASVALAGAFGDPDSADGNPVGPRARHWRS